MFCVRIRKMYDLIKKLIILFNASNVFLFKVIYSYITKYKYI